MATRRKKPFPGSKLDLTEALPVWTTHHSNTVNLVFVALLQKLGITDVASYFRQLRTTIVICIVIGAWVGTAHYDLVGFLLGGLMGLMAPAALLWLSVVLLGAAIFIAIYVAAWAAILWFLWWFIRA